MDGSLHVFKITSVRNAQRRNHSTPATSIAIVLLHRYILYVLQLAFCKTSSLPASLTLYCNNIAVFPLCILVSVAVNAVAIWGGSSYLSVIITENGTLTGCIGIFVLSVYYCDDCLVAIADAASGPILNC